LPHLPARRPEKLIFESERAYALSSKGEQIILVRNETDPNDIKGILSAKGVLTARGGKTSHAAVVTRGSGIPAVVGAHEIEIDYSKKIMTVGKIKLKEGEIVSIDGATGEVFLGALEKVDPICMTILICSNSFLGRQICQTRCLGQRGYTKGCN